MAPVLVRSDHVADRIQTRINGPRGWGTLPETALRFLVPLYLLDHTTFGGLLESALAGRESEKIHRLARLDLFFSSSRVESGFFDVAPSALG
jgi:hypothetical protein